MLNSASVCSPVAADVVQETQTQGTEPHPKQMQLVPAPFSQFQCISENGAISSHLSSSRCRKETRSPVVIPSQITASAPANVAMVCLQPVP